MTGNLNTPLAFAIILVTNMLVLFAAFRASGAAEPLTAPAESPAQALPSTAIPVGPAATAETPEA